MTGNKGVLRGEHFRAMKDGAVVCNSGHFNVEIDIPALEALSRRRRHDARVRRRVHARATAGASTSWPTGASINLVGRRGPSRRRSWTCRFANQALAAEFMVKNHASLARRSVYPVPDEIDREIARLKLAVDGHARSTSRPPEQARYMTSWEEGT